MSKFLFQPTHSMSRTSIYYVWQNMKARCVNPNNQEYHRYGGRGIQVCNEWKDSFPMFYKWAIENGYQEGLTLDRIDNDKGYFPGNCRWATWTEQSRNKCQNRMLTYNGKTQCITDWAAELGVSFKCIAKRIKTGRPIEEVLYKGKLERRNARKRTEDENGR